MHYLPPQHTRPLPAPHAMDTDNSLPAVTETSHFFRRSPSTVCLGGVPLSPFDPLSEALPLAEKPHLLEPGQCRESLFGYEVMDYLICWPRCPLPDPPILSLIAYQPSRGQGMHVQWPKLPPGTRPCKLYTTTRAVSTWIICASVL